MSKINENFICGHCSGILEETGEKIEGHKIYSCSLCGHGEQVECGCCHNPRTLWAFPYELCAICKKEQARKQRKIFRNN